MMRISGTARAAQTGAAFRSPLAQPQRKQQKGMTMNDLLGQNPARGARKARAGKAGKSGAGFSAAGMQAMLSASSSMKLAETQDSVITGLEGKAGVLEIEIRLDAGKGVSVERKKEELAEVEQAAADAGAAQMSSLADVNQAVKEASEAEAAAADDRAAEKKAETNGEKRAGSQAKKASGKDDSQTVQEASDSSGVSDAQGIFDAAGVAGFTGASVSVDGSTSLEIPVSTATPAAPSAVSLPAGYTPVDIRL